MDKKDQRINVTLFSTLEYEMVKSLAELHGTSLSMVVAKGCLRGVGEIMSPSPPP